MLTEYIHSSKGTAGYETLGCQHIPPSHILQKHDVRKRSSSSTVGISNTALHSQPRHAKSHVTSFSPQPHIRASGVGRSRVTKPAAQSKTVLRRAKQRCRIATRLETVDLDSLGIKTQALFLVRQEILHIFALVSLQLDHLSHLRVGNDGAIAGELLLDHFEDLLLVEFLGQALDRR